MNKLFFYIAMTLNIIMFVFFLLIISLGISDELADDMITKTRLFFAFGKLDPYLLSVFGILLPFLAQINLQDLVALAAGSTGAAV